MVNGQKLKPEPHQNKDERIRNEFPPAAAAAGNAAAPGRRHGQPRRRSPPRTSQTKDGIALLPPFPSSAARQSDEARSSRVRQIHIPPPPRGTDGGPRPPHAIHTNARFRGRFVAVPPLHGRVPDGTDQIRPVQPLGLSRATVFGDGMDRRDTEAYNRQSGRNDQAHGAVAAVHRAEQFAVRGVDQFRCRDVSDTVSVEDTHHGRLQRDHVTTAIFEDQVVFVGGADRRGGRGAIVGERG